MRLLHSRTLQLREFSEHETPPYAILSHTWGKGEISLQEMEKGQCSSKDGFDKIKQCCLQARRDGFEYAWIDTCCIDQSSSAELTEAINSMYRWYKNAQVCYAYLADVSVGVDGRVATNVFAESRWFTRGWTLQELIAPRNLIFYGSNWVQVGTKADLRILISRITGVDEFILEGGNLESVSLAKRMSWASKRVTRRTEDIEYCLLGIFNVNMPMLYGEGRKAFIRLQEEIMKDSDDQSLLAWGTVDKVRSFPERMPKLQGALATSPAEFASAENIVPFRKWHTSEPYSMTNKGLRVRLPLTVYDRTWVAILDCQIKNDFNGPIGIRLHPLTERGDRWRASNLCGMGDQFARLEDKPFIVPLDMALKAVSRTIYIRREVLYPDDDELSREHGFLIRRLPAIGYGFSLSKVHPIDMWHESQRIVRMKQSGAEHRWFAALLFEGKAIEDTRSKTLCEQRPFIVLLGYDMDEKQAWCTITFPYFRETLESVLRRACVKIKYSEASRRHYLHVGTHVVVRMNAAELMGQTMFVVDIDIRHDEQKQIRRDQQKNIRRDQQKNETDSRDDTTRLLPTVLGKLLKLGS